MLAITLVFGIGIFFLLPLFIASVTTSSVDNGLVQHLVEGLIRVALFLGYLLLISRAPDIQRVFQYHGAEHMTIHALEAGDPLTVDDVRKYPTAHQRCGTEFLVIVIILSILAFSLVGRQAPLVMILEPDPADPGHRRGRLRDPQVRGAPPREPDREGPALPGHPRPDDHDQAADDDMIEVAIVSMEQALVADGEVRPGRLATAVRAASRCELASAAAAATRRAPVSDRRVRRRRRRSHERRSTRKLAEVAASIRRGRRTTSAGPRSPRDPDEIRRLGQELARLEPTVEAFRRLEADPRRAGRCPRAARRDRRRRRDARDGPRRDRPARGRRDAARSRSSRSCCCRATPTTTAT